MLDEPAPQDGADARGDGREPRPRSDGPPPLLLRERGADDRQASGDEQGRAHALRGARGDELARALGQPASRRSDGEEQKARREDALSAEAITERASDQNQSGEHKRVSLHDPLRPDHVRPQLPLKHGQRHVDDRAVNEGDARSDDRRRQHPRGGRLRTRRLRRPSPNHRLVTRRFNNGRHRLTCRQRNRPRSLAKQVIGQESITRADKSNPRP